MLNLRCGRIARRYSRFVEKAESPDEDSVRLSNGGQPSQISESVAGNFRSPTLSSNPSALVVLLSSTRRRCSARVYDFFCFGFLLPVGSAFPNSMIMGSLWRLKRASGEIQAERSPGRGQLS